MATTSAISSSSTLDVPSLVAQLMTVERQPIDDLNARISTEQTKISSIGTLKSLAAGLQLSLKTLSSSLESFSAVSSSSSALSASAISTAVPGSYSVSVSGLAQSQNLVSAGQTSSTSTIGDGTTTTISFDFGTISGGTLTNGVYSGASFTSGGTIKTVTIDSTNNTLQGISKAINDANIGVTATIINDGSGTPYRLALTSNDTGVSHSMKITTSGGDGTIDSMLAYDPAGTQNLNQTLEARNAEFTVNGIAISKDSNTVIDAIQGVTLKLDSITTSPVTVTVAHDTDAIVTAAKDFVDAYNALTSQLKSRSAYGSDGKAGGALAGDGTLRLMLSQLHGIFTTAASGGTLSYLSQAGITTGADGSLTVDSTKMKSAMGSNYSDFVHLFSSGTGFATRLETWSDSVLATGGMLDTRTRTLNDTIGRYNSKIDDLEVRMTTMRKYYTIQFSTLNTLLANMNSMSAYLSQQFSSSSSGG